MSNQEFFREASAVAFGGRVVDLEDIDSPEKRIKTNLNLFAPNLSCALAAGGGRSRSRLERGAEFEINGINLASLGGADTEVFDREVGESLSIYSRARVENLRIGIDTRLHFEMGEVELATTIKGETQTFELRRAATAGLEFAGNPINVSFARELVAMPYEQLVELHDREKADAGCKVPRFVRHHDGYVEFNAVERLSGPGKDDTQHNRLVLTNWGTVEFGVVQAGEYFRRFILARLHFGSPYQGDARVADIIDGGRG